MGQLVKVDSWTIALVMVALGFFVVLMGLVAWGVLDWPPMDLVKHPLPLLLVTAVIALEAFRENRIRNPKDLANSTGSALELVLVLLSIIGIFVLASATPLIDSTAIFIGALYVFDGITFLIETFR